MEFPDAAVLGGRHGFGGVSMCANLSSRTAGVVRGGAPYERRGATLGRPGLALNGRAALGWGEEAVLSRGGDEELVREVTGRPT